MLYGSGGKKATVKNPTEEAAALSEGYVLSAAGPQAPAPTQTETENPTVEALKAQFDKSCNVLREERDALKAQVEKLLGDHTATLTDLATQKAIAQKATEDLASAKAAAVASEQPADQSAPAKAPAAKPAPAAKAQPKDTAAA